MANSIKIYPALTAAQGSFAFPFSYLNANDIKAYVDGTLVFEDNASTNTAVSGTTYTVAFQSEGATTLTFSPDVAVGREVRIERKTDLTTKAVDFADGAVLTEVALDDAVDQVFFAAQEAIDTANQAITEDPDGKWDAQSKVIKNVADPVNNNDAVNKQFISTNLPNINTVAGISSDVTTVAGIDTNVTTVAGNNANVTTVATNIADVNTVATNIADVITVADDLNEAISEIETAANDLNEAVSEIDTVSNSIANVNTVGTNIANVNTVAGNNANVTTVAGISSNVTTVAGISTDVSTVSSNNANVTTVAGNDANITTVAGIDNDVTTVAGISGNVTTVAGIDTDVTTVAGNNTNVSTVAGISSDVSTVAGISANVTTVAGDSADIQTVAGDSADIQTVAGDSADIATVAGISSDVSTVATNNANVTTVATNISDVNNFADRYRVASTAPTTSLDEGDLYFDTTLNTMRVYNGTSFDNIQQGVTDVETDLPDIRPSLNLDFANSKTLDPRIDFTRASTATYYDGVTNVKAEENLLQYSQDFDNSVWSITGASGVSITDDNATAPDGTTTAALIQASATTSGHYLQRDSVGYWQPISGQTYTLSCYLKAGTISNVQFVFGNGADFGNAAYINVDLSAGTITHTASNISSSSITDVGSGWYRVTMSAPAIGSNKQGNFLVAFVNSASPTTRLASFTAAGTETYYVWGAQVEQRSSATAYTSTTSQPITRYQPALQTAGSNKARFDHDPVTGESKGLLIEAQRTNLFTYSVLSSSSGQYTSENTEELYNYAIAPDGTQTATFTYSTSTTLAPNVYSNISLTAGTYTLSTFAKKYGDNHKYVVLMTNPAGYYNDRVLVKFDLDTGIKVRESTAGTEQSIISTSSEDVGNGWYRVSLTFSTTAPVSGHIVRVGISDNSGTSLATSTGLGSEQEGILIWGRQIEEGSGVTSYIPTDGSQVTRSIDTVKVTGDNFASIFPRHSGVSVMFEGHLFDPRETTYYPRLTTFVNKDAPDTNEMGLYVSTNYSAGNGDFIGLSKYFGTDYTVPSSSAYVVDPYSNFKAGFRFGTGGSALSVDGETTASTTGSGDFIPDNLNELRIGGRARYQDLASGMYCKKLAIYKGELPNATLQRMSED